MFADFEQYVEAWSGRIELSTAVVRDQDTVRASFVCKQGVLDGLDTLDDDRCVRERSDPSAFSAQSPVIPNRSSRNVVPVQIRIHTREHSLADTLRFPALFRHPASWTLKLALKP